MTISLTILFAIDNIMRHCYLLCYDISSPRRLRKVAVLLQKHGERVQKSVFECWLTPSQCNALTRQAQALLNLETDSVRVYRLSPKTVATCQVFGCGQTPKKPQSIVI